MIDKAIKRRHRRKRCENQRLLPYVDILVWWKILYMYKE